jgi:hypothetical protein
MKNAIFCDNTMWSVRNQCTIDPRRLYIVLLCISDMVYIVTSVSRQWSVNSIRRKAFSAGTSDGTVEQLFGEVFSVRHVTLQEDCWEKCERSSRDMRELASL